MVSVGGTAKIPRWLGKIMYGNDFIGQGGSAGLAFSYKGRSGGELDLGVYAQAGGGGEDYGTGRYTVDVAARTGSVRDMNGQGAELSFNDGVGGMTVTFHNVGNMNGVGVQVGPGYNVGGAGTVTQSWTVRDAIDWGIMKFK